MEGLNDQLGAILNDPGMMEKLTAMARTLAPAAAPEDRPLSPPDTGQAELLHALGPYLSPQRLGRLERALRGARMAEAALTMLTSQTGR